MLSEKGICTRNSRENLQLVLSILSDQKDLYINVVGKDEAI